MQSNDLFCTWQNESPTFLAEYTGTMRGNMKTQAKLDRMRRETGKNKKKKATPNRSLSQNGMK